MVNIDDEAVDSLAGTLPSFCQKDVDILCRFVRATISRESPDEAVSPANFKEVMLTGATGFIGRFVLRDLLQSDGNLVVHCLVRADSAGHGLKRLRDAMRKAGVWDEAFTSRIRPVAGDIADVHFGLEIAEFSTLCQRIDAVYHFAAELNLSASYANIRKGNTFSISNVLELCLHTRFKHLFFASTMGVFPQYFCAFANEFENSRIEHHMQPDPESMKKVFPLGLFGYPWSKLVTEQVLLFARQAGLPLGIFRLPQTGSASTGVTQLSDIAVRLASAVADTGMMPRGFTMQRGNEAVDILSRTCISVSLNPARRFTIYHCCDPEPVHHDLEPADIGFYWPEVSYAAFKRACQERGEQSPLHRHWPVLDHLAQYWFSDRKAGPSVPVCDRAIREDCQVPVKWPGLLTMLTRSGDWIRGQRDWPYGIPQSRLDFDSLIGRAERLAERAGVPFEQACPEWMRGRLKRLVQALSAPESRLLESRHGFAAYNLSNVLRNNAALARERRLFPEIDRETVARPIFIVGINRSGTTFLHRLLARSKHFQTLRFCEYAIPTLPAEKYASLACSAEDPRQARIDDMIEASGAIGTFAGIHPIDKDEPEEDFPLLGLSFSSWLPTVQYHLPDYAQWLSRAGSHQAYVHHRSAIQHFTWQRRRQQTANQGQWLFKMPFHLMELEALIAAYPDALFIQTHRDPSQVMGSWNSLVERVRAAAVEPRPHEETGAEQLAFMSSMLNRGARFRLDHPELEHRWVDVSYIDLLRDPLAVVHSIHDRFELPLEPAAIDGMNAWLALQAERRHRENRHSYRLEDYGLTPEAVDAAFSPYRDFMNS